MTGVPWMKFSAAIEVSGTTVCSATGKKLKRALMPCVSVSTSVVRLSTSASLSRAAAYYAMRWASSVGHSLAVLCRPRAFCRK